MTRIFNTRPARLMSSVAVLALSSAAAFAQVDPAALAAAYAAEGYVDIEVEVEGSTVEIEARKGNVTVEVTYDRQTGAILESEQERDDDNDDDDDDNDDDRDDRDDDNDNDDNDNDDNDGPDGDDNDGPDGDDGGDD